MENEEHVEGAEHSPTFKDSDDTFVVLEDDLNRVSVSISSCSFLLRDPLTTLTPLKGGENNNIPTPHLM
jgi:hypothetical protein